MNYDDIQMVECATCDELFKRALWHTQCNWCERDALAGNRELMDEYERARRNRDKPTNREANHDA